MGLMDGWFTHPGHNTFQDFVGVNAPSTGYNIEDEKQAIGGVCHMICLTSTRRCTSVPLFKDQT